MKSCRHLKSDIQWFCGVDLMFDVTRRFSSLCQVLKPPHNITSVAGAGCVVFVEGRGVFHNDSNNAQLYIDAWTSKKQTKQNKKRRTCPGAQTVTWKSQAAFTTNLCILSFVWCCPLAGNNLQMKTRKSAFHGCSRKPKLSLVFCMEILENLLSFVKRFVNTLAKWKAVIFGLVNTPERFLWSISQFCSDEQNSFCSDGHGLNTLSNKRGTLHELFLTRSILECM